MAKPPVADDEVARDDVGERHGGRLEQPARDPELALLGEEVGVRRALEEHEQRDDGEVEHPHRGVVGDVVHADGRAAADGEARLLLDRAVAAELAEAPEAHGGARRVVRLHDHLVEGGRRLLGEITDVLGTRRARGVGVRLGVVTLRHGSSPPRPVVRRPPAADPAPCAGARATVSQPADDLNFRSSRAAAGRPGRA